MWPVLSLTALSSASFAQGIGTWSAERSPDPLGTSPRFDELRARLRQELPAARLVPLHTLSGPVLALLDLVVLDGHGVTPPSQQEQDALLNFVRGGGLLVADGSGPTGAPIAAAFGVEVRGSRHEVPHVDVVPEGSFDGPSKTPRTFGTAGTEHLLTTAAGALSVGDADGAHLISLRSGQGRAVFVGSMSAFADRDAQPPGRFGDNASLLVNLIASALPAPRVGTWSTARSKVGFASSDAFDGARRELRARMPGLAFVEIDALAPGNLTDLDAVLLDSTPQTPLTAAEIDALRGFVASGGSVVAQLSGATGEILAGMYALAVVGTPQAAVNRLPVTPGVQSTALAGPFGPVSTYANRYEASIGTRSAQTEAVPLVHSPGGAHVVYVPATASHGSALLLTNLFAFGDPDWSVGGLVNADNDNMAMLGNFLAAAVRSDPAPTAPPVQPARGWQAEYVEAASAAVKGQLAPLRSWSERYRDDVAARPVIDHVTAWIAAPPEVVVDPRFFPVDGTLLGVTTRKDLLKSGHKPNRESKWTFDVGHLTWTCVEDKEDRCDLARVTTDLLPAVWSAAGLQTTATPEELLEQFRVLGYKVELGVASESPFGRQVVATGFGVLWQADYSLKGDGERLLVLSARRTR